MVSKTETYTCTSENSVGKTEASAMLQVHGKKHIMHIEFEDACIHEYAQSSSQSKAVFTHKVKLGHITTASTESLLPHDIQWAVFLYQSICESMLRGGARSLC